MIVDKLNKIELKFLDLIENHISISEFENWVYDSKWLINTLEEDEYIELISVNYKTISSKNDIYKVLYNRFKNGRFETLRLMYFLNSIINRDGKEAYALTKIYDLYYNGYSFLEELGLGIGLNIASPDKYITKHFHELTKIQKEEIVNKAYPEASELAKNLKTMIINGKIILKNIQDTNVDSLPKF